MGSISRMKAIDRFMEKHEYELLTEITNSIPKRVMDLGPTVELVNNCDEIEVTLAFRDPLDPNATEWLDLDPISVYELEGRDAEFGDCCEIAF